MKKIIVRADSSSTIGTGHIMRDIVLAKREFPNDRVIFAVRDLQGNINQKIDEAGFEKVTLESNDIDELAELVQKYRAETLVIDHYGIGYEDEKRLKEQTVVTLFVLDDTYEKHYCDILLNHNIYAEAERYKDLVPKYCELRCGEKFMLIRDEFHAAKKKKEKEKISLEPSGKTHVFVAMGGADTANLNIPILETLARFKEFHVHIITTRANKHLERLKTLVSGRPDVTLYIETDRIAELMAGSDFAIVTPSVTINEVIFMKIPFIAIKTADNQREMVRYLHKMGMPYLKSFDALKLRKEIEKFLVTTTITTVNFPDMNDKEKRMVLEWRNHPDVRRWMFNDSPIPYQEHLRFIESLEKYRESVYMLVKEKKRPIGVIDLTKIDRKEGSAHIGIYGNPFLHGKGSLLMATLIRHAYDKLSLKKLIAEVFVENDRALRLYSRYGFKIIDEEKRNGHRIKIMELNNEYRNL